MTESMIWCLVLLINIPSRLSSGTEIVTKSVCQGDAVQLFRNVSFNNGSVVSIYTNGDSHTLIATGNSLSTFSILPEYKKKMFFDELGTFWIRKIQRSDEQKYELRSKIDTNIMKVYAQIFVMVAPTKHCRPKILKIDSALIATLESSECGYPTASVKWADYPGIYYMDKSTVKLPSGKESGTYHACVESPALKCVTDLKISDYCSSFVVEAHDSPAVSPGNTQLSPEMIVLIVILILMTIFLVVVIAIVVRRTKRKQDAEAVSREKGKQDAEAVSREKEWKEMLTLACGIERKYHLASENNAENESLMMPPISNRENKSVKYFYSEGPAAPIQRWIEGERRLYFHDWKMNRVE